MTYDDVKKVVIPNGIDTKIYEVVTNSGNYYKVASRTVLGANKKISKYEGKNVKILSINTIGEGML